MILYQLMSLIYGAFSHPLAIIVLASTPPASNDNSTAITLPVGIVSVVQLGFVGAVLFDVVGTHKFLVPRWTLDKVEEKHDDELRLKDDLITSLQSDVQELKLATSELQKVSNEKLMPALIQATEVSRAYVSELARRATIDPGHGN